MSERPSRNELLHQHTRIRRLLGVASYRAEAAVRDLETGGPAFRRAIEELRDALESHNADEERLLSPLLAGQEGPGLLRSRRMFEEHAAEHELFQRLLTRDIAIVAEGMNSLAEELDAHMAAEERTFLSPVVFGQVPAQL